MEPTKAHSLLPLQTHVLHGSIISVLFVQKGQLFLSKLDHTASTVHLPLHHAGNELVMVDNKGLALQIACLSLSLGHIYILYS